jgi:predicted N-acyltransferase
MGVCSLTTLSVTEIIRLKDRRSIRREVFWARASGIAIRNTMGCMRKNKDEWQNMFIYMNKYKDKLESILRKLESKIEMNSGD